MSDQIVEEITAVDDAFVEDDHVDENPVEDKTLSQADVDKIVQKRLKRQEETLAKKYADYDKLAEDAESFRKLQNEKSTDAERWEKREKELLASLQERDEKLTKLERSNLIADLASEKGLPKSFWKRVQGDDAEEIAEDMDAIIKDLGLDVAPGEGNQTPKPRKKLYGGGGGTEDPEPDTDAIVAKIPRGPQIRVDKPRTYK